MGLKINSKSTDSFLSGKDLERNMHKASQNRELLLSRKGKGSDFLGWIDLPEKIAEKDLLEIENASAEILESSEYVVVVGIGGSYMGSRSVIDSLSYDFGTTKSKILYAGHHLDPDYHHQLLEFLKDKDFSINVISKSGTTTEPAIAFRLLKDLLEKKIGKNKLNTKIIATTDKSQGALRKIAEEFKLKTFVIPDDVGGRYSVLTPVGLLPVRAAGLDIRKLVAGAQAMAGLLKMEKDPVANPACYYSATRNALYESGMSIEIMTSYNHRLHYIKEWWKQLFGESEGKEGKGLFPANVNFTTDLHSIGQYIQEGKRHLFETLLLPEAQKFDIPMTQQDDDADGLNYLSGKKMSEINTKAIHGTMIAHHLGGVPTFEIKIPALDEFSIGELLYFFEFACGISGYTLGINPFDQPGVENYKKNMFALLGKKGFENQLASLGKYSDWI